MRNCFLKLFFLLVGFSSFAQTSSEDLERGNAKFKLKDYKGAIIDFNKSIALNSNNVDAYYSRGTAKFQLRDFNGAISDYTKAIAITPKKGNIYFVRGLAKIELNQNAAGCKDVEIACSLGYRLAREKIAQLCK
jgi:tetratricopeptide (TPR) repeat protein